jgi:hypothetical protein
MWFDEPSKHFPDRIEIELHTKRRTWRSPSGFLDPLYRDGKSSGAKVSTGGTFDVAVIEIERAACRERSSTAAFTTTSDHCATQAPSARRLLMVGFPSVYNDTLAHMPVRPARRRRVFVRAALSRVRVIS